MAAPLALQGGCFNWPQQLFAPDNCVRSADPLWNNPNITLPFAQGDHYVDFTLQDVYGKPHRLRDLLQTKNVLLQFGSYTCNVFQNNIYNTGRLMEMHDFHSIVVYTTEAHPIYYNSTINTREMNNSPYFGGEKEGRDSKFEQAYTYDERLEAARATLAILPKDTLVLVDTLDETNVEKNNQFWCTYGPAPNAGYLLRQWDGKVASAQGWISLDRMNQALTNLAKNDCPGWNLNACMAMCPVESTACRQNCNDKCEG